jgi:hypothetical protein
MMDIATEPEGATPFWGTTLRINNLESILNTNGINNRIIEYLLWMTRCQAYKQSTRRACHKQVSRSAA